MSQENVEVVRAGFEAWSLRGWDGLVDFLDPEIQWTLRPDFPDAGTFCGLVEVRGLLRRFEEAFDEMVVEPLQFLEAGERVVVPLNWSGRGKGSGVEVAERQGETWVFVVRARKVAVVTEYRQKEEAFEAVGLREPPLPDQNA